MLSFEYQIALALMIIAPSLGLCGYLIYNASQLKKAMQSSIIEDPILAISRQVDSLEREITKMRKEQMKTSQTLSTKSSMRGRASSISLVTAAAAAGPSPIAAAAVPVTGIAVQKMAAKSGWKTLWSAKGQDKAEVGKKK